jgi:hypothetical protein
MTLLADTGGFNIDYVNVTDSTGGGPIPTPTPAPPPTSTAALLEAADLVPVGTFRLPQTALGSSYGFGSAAGCCGLGTYGVTFNAARNSIYVGGHSYEQRLAEIAIPSSFTGSPIATALSNLIDPLEGKIDASIPAIPIRRSGVPWSTTGCSTSGPIATTTGQGRRHGRSLRG